MFSQTLKAGCINFGISFLSFFAGTYRPDNTKQTIKNEHNRFYTNRKAKAVR